MKIANLKINKLNAIVLALVTAVVLLNCGCTGDLQEQTYSNITQQNFTFEKSDFGKAIGPVYSNARQLIDGQGWYAYITQEVGTDEMAQPANGSGWSDGGIYFAMEKHSWTSLTPEILTLWNVLYQGVLHSNRIIGELKSGKIKVPDNTSDSAAVSEMRTARAFYYWLIMDNFGDAPLVTKSNTSGELPSKTPRKKIYQFVVSQLTEAIPNLSESAGKDMYGRFNKWAAKTLLAAIYLNAKVYTGKAEWDKCLKQVNDVIKSGKYHLTADFSDPFKVHNDQYNHSIIFAIPFDAVNAPGFNIEQNVSFHAALKKEFQLKTVPYGAGSLKMVPQFGAVYDSLHGKREKKSWLMGYRFTPNGDTLRGSYKKAGQPLFFSRYYDNGEVTVEDAGFRIFKFQIEKGATGSLNNDWPYFRYARVLMIKAECLLRMGHAAQAASIVNHVRMRDFDNPKYAKVTASDLLGDSKINYGFWQHGRVVSHATTAAVKYGGFLDELGAEFAEEMYRRRDMIRFGIYETRSYLSHKPNGTYRTVYPIPQSIVNSNPNLKQNPNY
jgi:hypothetical protein